MYKFLTFLVFGAVLFCGNSPRISSNYLPIIMERPELEKSIFFRQNVDIYKPGKIFYKDAFIYLVEKNKGVHIINNSNPQTPLQIGFINIPGCVDISMRDNIIFADNAVDLVSVDISNYQKPAVLSRVKNIFPDKLPPDLSYMPSVFSAYNRPENTIIVDWELK